MGLFKIWKDHVTQYSNRYKEVQNADGTVTHEAVEGEVIQEGTPQNAQNFNDLEERILAGGEVANLAFLKAKMAEGRIAGLTDEIINATLTNAEEHDTINSQIEEINSNLTDLKKSVSDGKATVATAITFQGVATASDASFTTMAANIKTACTNKYNAGYNAGAAAAKPTARSLGSKSVSFGEGGGSDTITFPLNSGEYLQITGVSFKSESGRGYKGSDSYSLSVSGGNVTINMSISGGGGTSGTCTVTANAISCSV